MGESGISMAGQKLGIGIDDAIGLTGDSKVRHLLIGLNYKF